MNRAFNNAAQWEFRRCFKLTFYAWCYNSFSAKLVYTDFRGMYQMGGEL